jgi:predicted dehydrogenase
MADPGTVAVVGIGRAGLLHARAAVAAGLRVSAYSSTTVRSDRAIAFAAEFPEVPRIEIGDEKLCESAQLLVVALPPEVAHEVVPRFVRDAHQLLVEKPLALSTSRIEAIAETARTSGCRVTVGYNRRVYPAVARAREILQSDPPQTVEVTIVEDADFLVRTKGLKSHNHYLRHGASSHMLDLSNFLFGQQEVIDVRASSSRLNDWFTDYQFESRGSKGEHIITTIDAGERSRRGIRIVTASGSRIEIAPLERLTIPVVASLSNGTDDSVRGVFDYPTSYQESFFAQMKLVATGQVDQLHGINDSLSLSKLIDVLELASRGLRHD